MGLPAGSFLLMEERLNGLRASGPVAPSNSHFANLLHRAAVGSLPNGPAPHRPSAATSLADGSSPCPRMETELDYLISMPGRSSRTMRPLRPRLRNSSTGTPASSPASVVSGPIG